MIFHQSPSHADADDAVFAKCFIFFFKFDHMRAASIAWHTLLWSVGSVNNDYIYIKDPSNKIYGIVGSLGSFTS